MRTSSQPRAQSPQPRGLTSFLAMTPGSSLSVSAGIGSLMISSLESACRVTLCRIDPLAGPPDLVPFMVDASASYLAHTLKCSGTPSGLGAMYDLAIQVLLPTFRQLPSWLGRNGEVINKTTEWSQIHLIHLLARAVASIAVLVNTVSPYHVWPPLRL